MKTILITGCAGFIGSRLIEEILSSNHNYHIVGVDNFNDYYDSELKFYRLRRLSRLADNVDNESYCTIYHDDISDQDFVKELFREHKFDVVVNLAAQAGVRYSTINPDSYIESNIQGFFNILDESCRIHKVEHFIYASSSSVYGDGNVLPYNEYTETNKPVSLYAATKKSNELMAYAYSSMYRVPTTGLRFFTVYGEAGRPDMAYYKFADSLTCGEKIKLYNNGECTRDFTYVGDVAKCIERIIDIGPVPKKDELPYSVYNVGSSHRVQLLDFVKTLHESLKAVGVIPIEHNLFDSIEFEPKQIGDVVDTFSDSTKIMSDYGVSPTVTIDEGLMKFAQWYKEYNKK